MFGNACQCFFFSSRRRHTRWTGDWSSDVCSSDLNGCPADERPDGALGQPFDHLAELRLGRVLEEQAGVAPPLLLSLPTSRLRSEERRVGEKGRVRGGAGTYKKKKRETVQRRRRRR